MASKREIVEIPGLSHMVPIPMGAKKANIVFSSAIGGRDPLTGETSADPDLQAEMLFNNVRTFMKNAGGTTDDIVHMRVMLKAMNYRDSIDKEWVKMFPSDKDRPARRADIVDVRGKNVFFQVEIFAVL
jgi:2-iminobutanoate/2-iminopropanoate deaminase